MKEAAGFRMGPFELLDLIGADVTHAVMVSIYEQYFGEPMYQPSAQLAVRVAGGLLGRKTKQGFYNYDGPPAAKRADDRGRRAAQAGSGLDRRRRRRARTGRMARAAPASNAKSAARRTPALLCFVTPLGEDATSAIVRLKLDPGAHGRGRYAGRLQGPPHGDEDAADDAGNLGRGGRGAVGRRRRSPRSTTARASWCSGCSP